jgi:hypothetical protein
VPTGKRGKHPRGMPLGTGMFASSEHAWDQMASSSVNFGRKTRTVQDQSSKRISIKAPRTARVADAMFESTCEAYAPAASISRDESLAHLSDSVMSSVWLQEFMVSVVCMETNRLHTLLIV